MVVKQYYPLSIRERQRKIFMDHRFLVLVPRSHCGENERSKKQTLSRPENPTPNWKSLLPPQPAGASFKNIFGVFRSPHATGRIVPLRPLSKSVSPTPRLSR